MSLHLIIDIVLLAIVAYCGWRGWRNGIIVGVFGCLAIVVALIAGNLISSVYAGDFSGMLEPFGAGLVDGKVSDVINGVVDENGEHTDLISPDKRTDVYVVSRTAMERLGLSPDLADRIAASVAEKEHTVGQQMSDKLNVELCWTISRFLIFCIIFSLVLIVLTVIGNVLDVRFTLPGIELVNNIIGLLLGLVRGVLMAMCLAILLRYLGLLLPEGTLQKTYAAQWLIQHNYIADLLHI